jgi:ribonuclease-3
MVVTQQAIKSKHVIDKIEVLLTNLWIEYSDISNYILAFVHRSIVNERPDFTPEHNERLEFLWDAVLELSITNNLFRDFPEKTEWELTDIRSALVRWKNLAKVWKQLWFHQYLILWKWEEMSWWRENDYLLANVLEAFLGALYIDLWINYASEFVNRYIYSTLDEILKNNLTKDFKTIIQEYAQAKFDITPTYNVLDESWPDHDKDFLVWVFLKEKLIWKWNWGSKKKAQERAAEDWYNNLMSNKNK